MEKLVKLNDKSFRLFKTETEILSIVRDVARRINEDYIGKRPIIVPVLNGSLIFAADLVRELMLDCELSFIKASSHEDDGSANPGVNTTNLSNIEGRHLIIVEDVVDTGHTLSKILPALREKNPASVKVASLLVKPFNVKPTLTVDYIGLEIPNEFIVGYGMDYDGLGRNLRDIYQVVAD